MKNFYFLFLSGLMVVVHQNIIGMNNNMKKLVSLFGKGEKIVFCGKELNRTFFHIETEKDNSDKIVAFLKKMDLKQIKGSINNKKKEFVLYCPSFLPNFKPNTKKRKIVSDYCDVVNSNESLRNFFIDQMKKKIKENHNNGLCSKLPKKEKNLDSILDGLYVTAFHSGVFLSNCSGLCGTCEKDKKELIKQISSYKHRFCSKLKN